MASTCTPSETPSVQSTATSPGAHGATDGRTSTVAFLPRARVSACASGKSAAVSRGTPRQSESPSTVWSSVSRTRSPVAPRKR